MTKKDEAQQIAEAIVFDEVGAFREALVEGDDQGMADAIAEELRELGLVRLMTEHARRLESQETGRRKTT